MSSELDDKLKKLAIDDWEQFVAIMGEDSLVVAKMRLLKKEGKSYRQISLKLSVTESQVRYATKKTG